MTSEIHIKDNMNRMYRMTRHIYDATRKYYLLGRDHLINNLNPKDGENICEVGCGTARNLIKLAHKYPNVPFYGLDASDEMLKTARQSLEKRGVKGVKITQAYAQSFDPKTLFNLEEPLTKIIFSYSLSMIPPWKESIDHALELLPTGGEIHIVDFGNQSGLPKFFRTFLFWWLKMFHVYHKPEILDYLKQLDEEEKGNLGFEPLYKGYAWHAVFKKL
ncbi:MAG: O-methyltransferase [Micavibrio sp.]|nr:MAG: O-methyltransferase [Micavibrio sp.]